MNSPLPTIRQEDEASILRRTRKKLDRSSGLKGAGDLLVNVRTLFRMVRDRSFGMTWASRGMILAALLYFVMPMDATPDFIPILGFIDDALVVGMVVKRLNREIDRYRDHVAWS